MDRLTNKPKCLSDIQITLNGFTNSQMYWSNPTYVENKMQLQFPNPLPNPQICESTKAIVTAKVKSSGEQKSTTFYLNPNSCTYAPDVSFEKSCSRKDDEEKSKSKKSTSTGVIVCIGVGAMVLIITIITIIVIYRKKNERKSEAACNFNTDENHVYGTYSRGSREDGEYGDGDVVEVTDTNEYYA